MESKQTVSLEQYQNVVVLYRDENGALFIGNTYDYHGRTPDSASPQYYVPRKLR